MMHLMYSELLICRLFSFDIIVVQGQTAQGLTVQGLTIQVLTLQRLTDMTVHRAD